MVSTILICVRRANFVGTNSVGVQSEGEAEGGCGGNSASPEPKRSPSGPARSKQTDKEKFCFPFRKKIGRAQIKNCEQTFSLSERASASDGEAERQFRSKKFRAKFRISHQEKFCEFFNKERGLEMR
jgi:hypothetical protein